MILPFFRDVFIAQDEKEVIPYRSTYIKIPNFTAEIKVLHTGNKNCFGLYS